MRRTEHFIGGEKMEDEPLRRNSLLEIGLFILIGIGCIAFFLFNPDFPKSWFEAGKAKGVLSLFVILVLSPFGAHMISAMIVHLLEKIRSKNK